MGEEVRSEEVEDEVVTSKTTHEDHKNLEEKLEAHSALLQEHITEVRGVKRAIEESYKRAKEAEETMQGKLEELTEVTKKNGESYAAWKNINSVPLTTEKPSCSRDTNETIPKPSYAVIVTSNTIEDSELTNTV